MTETYKAQRSSGLTRSGRPAAAHLMLVAVAGPLTTMGQ
jgi:hypothetical protein